MSTRTTTTTKRSSALAGPPAVAAEATEKGDYVRPFEPRDEHMVKMIIGQGVMEGLARANSAFITHPLTLLLLLPLGLVLDYYANLLPSASNWLTYFTPFIGPAVVLIPVLGVAEYVHRPIFTARLRKVIGGEDMVRLKDFYAVSTPGGGSKASGKGGKGGESKAEEKGKGGKSGIWVFEHDGDVIGSIALDGQSGGEELQTVLGEEEGQIATSPSEAESSSQPPETETKKEIDDSRRKGLRKRTAATAGTTKTQSSAVAAVGHGSGRANSDIVQIRHLDVDQPWRRKGVASDLLLTALDYAFDTDPSSSSSTSTSSSATATVTKVIFRTNPLSAANPRLLTRSGFSRVGTSEREDMGLEEESKFGLGGWKGEWWSIDRSKWVETRRELLMRGRK